jgi:hypothetical protein
MNICSGSRACAVLLAALLAAACGSNASEQPQLSLALSQARQLAAQDGRTPTAAVDPGSGAIYVVWAQETPGPATESKKRADPVVQVLAARSDDKGASFGPPTRVNVPEDRVTTSTVTPPQVAVGPRGEVFVLYRHRNSAPKDWYKGEGWYAERDLLRLARSDDKGKTFSAPIEIGAENVEADRTSIGMLNLFVTPDGDVFVSWLDFRETMAYVFANNKPPSPREGTAYQLRVARSSDGGRTFARSALVTKPVCACCGTKLAQGASGPLYATTRGESRELKGSYDAVRDHFVSTSNDDGATWSQPVKFHDDGFKVSACPGITAGMGVDSKGRLHVAWYTGTERNPGVMYARSDDQGKTFSAPVSLLTDSWIPYADVKLAIDAADHAWVAFEDRRGERDLIQVARISPEGKVARSTAWPGTSPDIAGFGESVIVTWGTQAASDKERVGAIEWRIVQPDITP